MTYRITLTGGFRTGAANRMTRLWHPGTYDVPEEMPEVVASQALKSGVALKEKEPVPGIEDPAMAKDVEDEFMRVQGAEPEEEDGSDESPPVTVRRRPGRPRKTPAPENKLLKNARDDKSAMD